MPGLQPQAAESSSSDDEETIVSTTSVDHNDDDDSIRGSILNNSNDEFAMSKIAPNGNTIDAFNSQTVIPSPTSTPLYMVPPVSCVVIPNNTNDVNSSTTAPVNERVDPTGRIPVRIQQDCFAHVDDVIYDKPTLMNIGGKPIHNWAQFVDTRRSFPTQVTINHRVVKDNGMYTSIMPTLPNLFFYYRPKRAGVIMSRPSQLDPLDFHQGEN
jgi:hypothetical protein